MKIGELNQIILFIQDMAASVAFYRDKLGLKAVYPEGDFDPARTQWVVFDTGCCKVALRVGGRKRLGDDSPKLSFRVPSVKAAREELIGRGVEMLSIRPIEAGLFISSGTDPDGNRFSVEGAL
jgi:catechol 2,3-dioxygenase-like lactoylglutathione lyase family enzyme